MSDTDEILASISNKSFEEIKAAFAKFKLENRSFMDSMKLLNRILTLLSKRNNKKNKKDILEFVMGQWLDPEDNDIDLIIGDMASVVAVDVENLVYVLKTLEDVSAEEVLALQLEMGEESFNFSFTAGRLEEAFKNIPSVEGNHFSPDLWVRLLKIANKSGRRDGMAYILPKVEKKDEPLPPPEYMKETAVKVPSYINKKGEVKDNVKKAVLDMTSSEGNSELLNEIDEAMNGFSLDELSSIVSTFDQSSLKIDDPDMIEGPANPMFDNKGKVKDCLGALRKENKECRMLTCICILEDAEDEHWEVPKLSWYKGKCEHCKKIIAKACYCVRLPLDKGGWEGCFCAEDCAFKASWIARKLSEEDDGDETPEQYCKFNEKMALVQAKGIVIQENETLMGAKAEGVAVKICEEKKSSLIGISPVDLSEKEVVGEEKLPSLVDERNENDGQDVIIDDKDEGDEGDLEEENYLERESLYTYTDAEGEQLHIKEISEKRDDENNEDNFEEGEEEIYIEGDDGYDQYGNLKVHI